MDTQSLRAYLISPGELAPDWLVLYAATFALQLLCASLRGGLAYLVLWASFKLAGQSTSYLHAIALLIAYGPLAVSLFTLILPLAPGWPPAQLKARYPSEPEKDLYHAALAEIRRADPCVRPPRQWYVQDTDHASANAYADALLLSSGLLEHEQATTLLAQALAHLNSSDARLTAALARLTITPPDTVPRGLKTICMLAGGAAGMWPLKGTWQAYWRTREHHARRYAESLVGQQLCLSLDGRWQVAGRSEPVKGTPSGPPSAGPVGLPLTEPERPGC